MAEIDLSSASPHEVYEAVREMDGEEFDELMEDPADRARVINAMVDHMAGLFNPEAAGDLDAAIHIKLWDHPEGGYDHLELRIRDGECRISHQPGEEAEITLKTRPSDLRAMVTGETGPRRLALRRRLTVLGDLKLAAKLPDLFEF